MNKKIIAFALLLLFSQLAYFSKAVALAAVSISALLIVWLALTDCFKLKISKSAFGIIVCFFLMCCLSALLMAFGDDSDNKSRALILYSLVQFALAFMFFQVALEGNGQQYIVNSYIVFLAIEFFIVVGQFSFLTFGIGLEPRVDADVREGFIVGAFGNPNNESAVVLMASMICTYFLQSQKKYHLMLWILSLSFATIILTLSRTALIIFIAYVILLMTQQLKIAAYEKSIKDLMPLIGIAAVGFLTALMFMMASEQGTFEVIDRSIDRVASINELVQDESVGFRMIAHVRLVENIFNLGLGTFSDLEYFRFFEPADYFLMKINPHSFVVEYSFLFGYAGLLTAFALLGVLANRIFRNKSYPVIFRWLFILSLFMLQAVPSSILTIPSFFIPFLFFAYYKKQ